MNKITRKFLGAFLSLGLLATLSFASQARIKDTNYNNKTVATVSYEYKNKGLTNNLKFNDLGAVLQNDTTEKEVLNYYIIMKKMFEKYDIPTKENLEFLIPETIANSERMKLSGALFTVIDPNKKDNFKNLFKNFNKNLKDIVITKEDLKDAKKEIIDILKKHINFFEDKINLYKNYDFNKKEDLIEAGRISIKKSLESVNKLKDTASDEFKGQIKRRIKNLENTLKNAKELEKEGRLVYKKNINPAIVKYIPNLKKQIDQVENVNLDDVVNLTKDLKINDKNLRLIDMK